MATGGLGLTADDAVPASAALLVDAGAATVGRFLDANGWSLVTTRPEQVRAVPGRRWAVRHQTRARDRNGRTRTIPIVVEALRRERPLPPASPAAPAGHGLGQPAMSWGCLRAWAFPYDPELPDLAVGASGAAVRDALVASGEPAAAVSTELLRYRPGRRAVFRYTVIGRRGAGLTTTFGKVLRPHRAERLYDAAAAIEGRNDRLQRSMAWPRPLAGGAMRLDPIPGDPLRRRLLDGGSLPSPHRLAHLSLALARLTPPHPPAALAPDARRHPARLAEHAALVLGHAAPALGADVARVTDRVLAAVDAGWAPSALVHADLYDDQIFVGDGFELGVIDLDDMTIGDPALDAANLCAHLLALALAVPAAAARLVAYHTLLRTAVQRELELAPGDLAWREALCVLMLATGPLRVLSPTWPRETARLVEVALRLASGR